MNVRLQTLKLIEENRREKHWNISTGNDFQDILPKTQETKKKLTNRSALN
jgi:hypothetical protein